MFRKSIKAKFRTIVSHFISGAIFLQPFGQRVLASSQVGGNETVHQELDIDAYSNALYSTLLELQNQTVNDDDKKIISSFKSNARKTLDQTKYDPFALTQTYKSSFDELHTIGAKACLQTEFGLLQIAATTAKYFKESSQYQTLEEIVTEINLIRKEASCLSDNFKSGRPINLAADFTYLNELIIQGINFHSNDLLKKDLLRLLNIYLTSTIQGVADAQFFNVSRIKKQFDDAGIGFTNIEEVKTEAYKQVLISKAQVSGLFIGGLGGFLAAFLGAGKIVEEGVVASGVIAKSWNTIGAPMVSTLTKGRFAGTVENLEKASYVLSSSFIGALGGSSVHGLTLAAETFKEASVASFENDSSLGAELIPAISKSMNGENIKEEMGHGAMVGGIAGAALTFGSFEYTFTNPFTKQVVRKSPRHATLILLASAVIFSTAMGIGKIIKFISEGRQAISDSGAELLKIKADMSPTEKKLIFAKAKELKVKAYNSFGEAALNGIDVAILMVLVNELFIKGELFHIWNAHESEVVKAVATGSDETPTAVNNVAQAMQNSVISPEATAKTSKLVGNVADDAGKVVGTITTVSDDAAKVASIKGSGLKSIIAKTGSLTGNASSTVPAASAGFEQIGSVLDPNSIVATLPLVEDELPKIKKESVNNKQQVVSSKLSSVKKWFKEKLNFGGKDKK